MSIEEKSGNCMFVLYIIMGSIPNLGLFSFCFEKKLNDN